MKFFSKFIALILLCVGVGAIIWGGMFLFGFIHDLITGEAQRQFGSGFAALSSILTLVAGVICFIFARRIDRYSEWQ